MKCSKCEKEAEFDTPELLCDEHWAKWWAFNQPGDEFLLSPQQEQKYYEEVLERLRNKRKHKFLNVVSTLSVVGAAVSLVIAFWGIGTQHDTWVINGFIVTAVFSIINIISTECQRR